MPSHSPAPAALKLDSFIRQYRSAVPVRMLLTVGLTVMLGMVAPIGQTALFAIVHLALYGLLFGAVELAARCKVTVDVRLAALTWRTAFVTALLMLHVCLVALQVRAETTSTVVKMERRWSSSAC